MHDAAARLLGGADLGGEGVEVGADSPGGESGTAGFVDKVEVPHVQAAAMDEGETEGDVAVARRLLELEDGVETRAETRQPPELGCIMSRPGTWWYDDRPPRLHLHDDILVFAAEKVYT